MPRCPPTRRFAAPIWGKTMTELFQAGPVQLRVAGLKAWYGESRVLSGVDLEVRRGETVSLLGRNGAGKTSTLRAILGLTGRREGGIEHGGRDLTQVPTHRIAAAGIGYVPENRGIFAGLSTRENLLLPPLQGEPGFSEAALYELFPNLQTRAGAAGTSLSGGEQQMLSLARVLRSGVRTLLLDELTEGLAPVIVGKIRETLNMLKGKGYTILLVEQNFRFARKVADRFYVMEDGRIVDHFHARDIDGRSERLEHLLGV